MFNYLILKLVCYLGKLKINGMYLFKMLYWRNVAKKAQLLSIYQLMKHLMRLVLTFCPFVLFNKFKKWCCDYVLVFF